VNGFQLKNNKNLISDHIIYTSCTILVFRCLTHSLLVRATVTQIWGTVITNPEIAHIQQESHGSVKNWFSRSRVSL